MLPILLHYADGKGHPNQETYDALSEQFHLTPEERAQSLPSGPTSVFINRVAWAKTYLKRAGLIDSTRRGVYCITDRGRNVLEQKPEKINIRFLNQFPEFLSLREKKPDNNAPEPAHAEEMTPSEHILTGYQQIREELVTDVLQRVKESPPEFFEQLVIDLLLAMGYGGSRLDAGRTVGKSGDGGIDGIINEDRLGLDVVYIQAKRWEGIVGRPEIQKFAGALQGKRARKGIFITTSSYTKEARDYASMIENKIVLLDGASLAELMIDNNIGVANVAMYEVKRIDSDYFGQE